MNEATTSDLDRAGHPPLSARFDAETTSLVDVPLPERIARAKLAYTTRHVPVEAMAGLRPFHGSAPEAPRPGDLLLARVEEIGQHRRLELRCGRRAQLYPGDEIVVCYGNRYAPDQFEARVPHSLEPCDLVAAGGIAARMLSGHGEMRAPTRIAPIGLISTREERRANLERWALPEPRPARSRPSTFAVLGTSMNAGKTTTAANLTYGLAAAGHRVGAAKVTGTGAGGDVWHLTDAGAELVLDFTAAGLASTYLAQPEAVVACFELLTGHLAAADLDVIVLEVADGLFQRETAALLRSPSFAARVDGVLFAGSDALGVTAGVEALEELGAPVIAASGVVSSSPLARGEAETRISVPILDIEGLRDAALLAGAGIRAGRCRQPSLAEELTAASHAARAADGAAQSAERRAGRLRTPAPRPSGGAVVSREAPQAATRATLLYDLDCGFCRWSLAKILAWDRGHRLRPLPIQGAEGHQLLSGMSEYQRLRSWHLVTAAGECYSAGAVFAPLMRLLPGGRPGAVIAARAQAVVEHGYRWVADHRPLLSRLVPDAARRRADRRIERCQATLGDAPATAPQARSGTCGVAALGDRRLRDALGHLSDHANQVPLPARRTRVRALLPGRAGGRVRVRARAR